MKPLPGAIDGWIELNCPSGGCTIALHQAAKSQKSGAAIKVVFAVKDVRAFVRASEKEGLQFGAVHRTDGFEFANAKDPSGNSISVASQGLWEAESSCNVRGATWSLRTHTQLFLNHLEGDLHGGMLKSLDHFIAAQCQSDYHCAIHLPCLGENLCCE
jgi:hypothetical protein